MSHQKHIQAMLVEQPQIDSAIGLQRIALFGPDGKPLLFATSESRQTENPEQPSEPPVTAAQLAHLKGRVTKIERRIKEWEAE